MSGPIGLPQLSLTLALFAATARRWRVALAFEPLLALLFGPLRRRHPPVADHGLREIERALLIGRFAVDASAVT
jgi:hypothetical protein